MNPAETELLNGAVVILVVAVAAWLVSLTAWALKH